MAQQLEYERSLYYEARGEPLLTKIVVSAIMCFGLASLAGTHVLEFFTTGGLWHCAELTLFFCLGVVVFGTRLSIRVDANGLHLTKSLCGRQRYSQIIDPRRIENLEQYHPMDTLLYRMKGLNTSYRSLALDRQLTKFSWFGQGVQFSIGQHRYLIGSRNPGALLEAIQAVKDRP